MHDLRNPETGEHVVASDETAAALVEEGWIKLGPPTYAEPAEPKKSRKKEQAGGGSDDGATDLSKMKLPELIAHAEQIGITGDDLDALKKPGTSKAKAIEAIQAHTAGGNADE